MREKWNMNTAKKTAVTGVCILVIAVFLFAAFCPSAGAVGLVDDTVDAAHEYSRYPLENYQLDFYVDNGWDWLPWNWIDGIGKQVMYGLYCITNFIWTINLYISNGSGYLVQEAYSLNFVSSAADEIGKNIQSIAGISPSGLSADGFYAGFLLLIILVVGAYVTYVGLIKRETTRAVRAVMNMVLIFVLSGALIAYAPDCVKRLNEFSEDVSTASLSVGTKIVLPDAGTGGTDSVALIRDSLFSIQVKQPWLLLQFGDTDTDAIGADRVDSLLSASPSENNGEDRENVVKSEIEDNGNTNLTVTKAVNRLGTVFFLFLFNIGISVFVFLLTGMMIFSQVLFIIYAMFLPVSFVLSMVPTFEGSSRRAVIKLFNTILARAGITLVITIAFSISTMLYRIASGYPFFIIAFLQVVVFAGIYFKLGDLLSMFSLHDDGARGMGRYIMHRPRMFLHHQLHRLNRTMRAAAAGRPNGGTGSGSNGANSSAGAGAGTHGRTAGGWYRSGPYGGSSAGGRAGYPSSGGINVMSGTVAPRLSSGGAGTGSRGNAAGSTPHRATGGTNGAASGQPTGLASGGVAPALPPASSSGTAPMLPSGTAGGVIPALPPGNTAAGGAPSGSTSQNTLGRHTRPVIVTASAGQQIAGAKSAQAMSKPLLPPPQQPPAAVDTTKKTAANAANSMQPHERPAVAEAPQTASSAGHTANSPAPHEHPAAVPQGKTVQQSAPQAETVKPPVHTENRRPDVANRPAVRQEDAGKPVMAVQGKSATREQSKPEVLRPAVQGAAPKQTAAKNSGTRRSNRKYSGSPKNNGKRDHGSGNKQDGGGGR